MPDDTTSSLPPVVLPTAEGPKTFSRSPEPGEPMQRRRVEDTKTYAVPWTAVGVGLLMWSISFFNEIASLSWQELTTLKFVAGHTAQVLGVIAAVLGMRQVKN